MLGVLIVGKSHMPPIAAISYTSNRPEHEIGKWWIQKTSWGCPQQTSGFLQSAPVLTVLCGSILTEEIPKILG